MPKTTSLKGVISGTFQPPRQPQAAPATPQAGGGQAPPPPGKPLAQSDLTGAWNAYAETIRTTKPGLFSLMQTYPPVLSENHKITVRFEGLIQAELFQEVKPELIAHLKNALQSANIAITEEIDTAEALQKNRLFLPEDKLKFLAEKNPALLRMKQRLGLELE